MLDINIHKERTPLVTASSYSRELTSRVIARGMRGLALSVQVLWMDSKAVALTIQML